MWNAQEASAGRLSRRKALPARARAGGGEQSGIDSDSESWTPEAPWLPRIVVGASLALLLGVALVGPWLYTDKFWPMSLIGLDGSTDEGDLSPWPDRTVERPGGGIADSEGDQYFVLLVASGLVPEDEAGHTLELKRWQHEEQRLQQRLDSRFPEEGLVAKASFIRGTHVVGLIISRWYEEDDPGLQGVLTWVRELDDGQYSEATRRKITSG